MIVDLNSKNYPSRPSWNIYNFIVNLGPKKSRAIQFLDFELPPIYWGNSQCLKVAVEITSDQPNTLVDSYKGYTPSRSYNLTENSVLLVFNFDSANKKWILESQPVIPYESISLSYRVKLKFWNNSDRKFYELSNSIKSDEDVKLDWRIKLSIY